MTTTGMLRLRKIMQACICGNIYWPIDKVSECRHLYEPDGHFTDHHIQDWQHSAMYLAFMLAGSIDLMAYYTQLPVGIEQVRRKLLCQLSKTFCILQALHASVQIHTVLFAIIFVRCNLPVMFHE